MKIRIEKSTNPNSWYASKIGETLIVEGAEINQGPHQGIPDDVYWCREGGQFNALNWVLQKDATIINSYHNISAAEWDGPKRKAARLKNPNAWRLAALDIYIREAREEIESQERRIDSLMKERASYFNEDEKACNLFCAMQSWAENEVKAKAMTIDQLAEHLWRMQGNGLDEAVISEVLARAGYVYSDDGEIENGIGNPSSS